MLVMSRGAPLLAIATRGIDMFRNNGVHSHRVALKKRRQETDLASSAMVRRAHLLKVLCCLTEPQRAVCTASNETVRLGNAMQW